MRRGVSIGLFTLLLCHIMATAIVDVVSWWHAEKDLSKRLSVFRSVDSIVEFQIPLRELPPLIAPTTEDGFSYHGRYYTVVSLEVKGDTLQIAGLEVRSHSVWPTDLLGFLNDHLGTSSDMGQKANQLLKVLQKEYPPAAPTLLSFARHTWYTRIRIPDASSGFTTRSLSILSPPPRA